MGPTWGLPPHAPAHSWGCNMSEPFSNTEGSYGLGPAWDLGGVRPYSSATGCFVTLGKSFSLSGPGPLLRNGDGNASVSRGRGHMH